MWEEYSMKKLFLTACCVFFSIYVTGQTVTVKDIESNQKLELVTIASEKPLATTSTNSKGEASLIYFKGSNKIEFQLLGFQTLVKSYNEIEADNFVVFLTPADITLDQVIISATKWAQHNSDVPFKIVSVNPKDVELQNSQTAADLLGISGKVFIQKSQQGGGSPMIRGFATNRLLYTVDGVRMNTAIFRSGNIQNVISLDPYSIENTEVFFGPGSVIYGSDAIGGVMSFRTLTPQLSLNGEQHIKFNSVGRYSSANNENTLHFNLNLGWEKWALVTSITTNNYDDLRMGANGTDDYIKPYYVERIDNQDVVFTSKDPKIQRPSAYSQFNLMQKIRYKPNNFVDVNYGFQYSETSEYGRYDRHLRMRNNLPRYAEWKYGPQKWMMNNLNIDINSINVFFDKFIIRLALQNFEESRINRSLNNNIRSIKVEKVDAYSINFDLVKSLTNKLKFYYGTEYVLNDVKSTGTNENIESGEKLIGPSRYPDAKWQSIAAYANSQYKFSEKYLLQVGLRYNHFLLDAKFDTSFYPFPFTEANLNSSELTGSVGFVYKPSDSWVISTNLSTGFRTPNVDDIGKVFDSEPGSVVVPNPNLNSEYAYNVDVSLAKIINNNLKVDLTGYYTILENALVRRDYTLNGQDSIFYDGILSNVQAIQNAAGANVYGVQFGLEAKLTKGLNFYTDINYQKGEEELDDGSKSASRHAAPWFGVTRFSYSYKKLNLQIYSQYQGEVKFDNLPVSEQGKTEIYASDKNGNPYSPGWYTLNFKAMYAFNNNITLSTGLENLTDQRYRSYSSGISAPGRNFIISARISL